MKENQAVCFGVLFACNVMSSQLISTGAFEVYIDNDLIFSKLQTGHVPDIHSILRQVKSIASQTSSLPRNAY
jgi:selT/selW/selH-like putative selenoprotein